MSAQRLETSALADGTQWAICEAGGGDEVARMTDGSVAAAPLCLLLASAPDLLAKLEEARGFIRDRTGDRIGIRDGREFLRELDAVIAAAKGVKS